MRERFDAISKDLVLAHLADLGRATRGEEVVSSVQRIDVLFVPDEERRALARQRDLLGALVDADGPCHLEPFRNTPGVPDARACVRRFFNHLHMLGDDAVRLGGRFIVISPGRLELLLAAVDAPPDAAYGPGVYRTNALTAMWVVVASELPDVRQTLSLRLLGKGAVFRRATEQLLALPDDAWEHRFTEILVRWRLVIVDEPNPTDEERDFMQATQSALDRIRALARDEGLSQGLSQGLQAGRTQAIRPLAHQFERRLGRELSREEHATLLVRLDKVGADRLGDVALDMPADELAAWLANPEAR